MQYPASPGSHELGKIAVYQRDLLKMRLQPLLCGLQRHGVAVDTDQAAGREPLANLQRMACPAERPVEIDPVRLHVQHIDRFMEQDGLMCKFHQNPSSSMTAARFSGVSVSLSSFS